MNQAVTHSEHHFNKELPFDYSKINENIYLGTNACCQEGFSKELLNKGIEGDISLEFERMDRAEGVKYFLWLPVKDHYAPTQKQLDLGVLTMQFFMENGIKFYCHCKNGHGRAPTLVAAYFIYTGMEVNEAVEFVKSKRPSIHLEDSQYRALEEFKKRLNRGEIPTLTYKRA